MVLDDDTADAVILCFTLKRGDELPGRADLAGKMAALEYSGLIGKVFKRGPEVKAWEMRNFNGRTFYEMDTADLRKGIVLLLDVRKQQILIQIG